MLTIPHICSTSHIYAHYPTCMLRRDEGQSDTADTDDAYTRGGVGLYEYSKKGLPHALEHTPELVMQGGHHLAFCSSMGEVSHKFNIKLAARFSRIYACHNLTESKMLEWVCWQHLFNAVTATDTHAVNQPSDTTLHGSRTTVRFCQRDNLLGNPLPFTEWSQVQCDADRTPRTWGATLLSNRVLITRDELLTLMRTKLQMEPTLTNNVRLLNELQWEFYGTYSVYRDGRMRRYVGISSTAPRRRDIVRLRGSENGTVYASQVENTYTFSCQHIRTLMNIYVRIFNSFDNIRHRCICLSKSPVSGSIEYPCQDRSVYRQIHLCSLLYVGCLHIRRPVYTVIPLCAQSVQLHLT